MSRCLGVITAIYFLTALVQIGAVSAAEATLRVTLTIEPGDISAFDPVFAKVEISNESDVAVRGPFPFTVEAGTVTVELRRKSDATFKRIPLKFENALLEPSDESQIRLPGSGKLATYVLISESPNRRLFEVPGEYELRAVVGQPNRHLARSESVLLNVASPTADAETVADANKLFLSALTKEGLRRSLLRATVVDVAHKLPDSQLRASLQMLGHVAAIRDANSKDTLVNARKSVEEIRKDLPQIEKEWLALILARQYNAMTRPDLSLEESKHLDPVSAERSEIVRLVRAKMEADAEIKTQ